LPSPSGQRDLVDDSAPTRRISAIFRDSKAVLADLRKLPLARYTFSDTPALARESTYLHGVTGDLRSRVVRSDQFAG